MNKLLVNSKLVTSTPLDSLSGALRICIDSFKNEKLKMNLAINIDIDIVPKRYKNF